MREARHLLQQELLLVELRLHTHARRLELLIELFLHARARRIERTLQRFTLHLQARLKARGERRRHLRCHRLTRLLPSLHCRLLPCFRLRLDDCFADHLVLVPLPRDLTRLRLGVLTLLEGLIGLLCGTLRELRLLGQPADCRLGRR